ncbi:LLM class flavin-dependent oxidoreductase [Haloechinothrix sp. LS1_15]|uniref:LLM class flavin-dependent oxidoreductase n=1 Tax=Haloechinothrix sp. LS1_15 TaxID=2652248 RepID=UPI002946DFEB|nr:LLM class flavin-dependent oxidoreductase [Haloechinothrix sp. LS1_15]MDV6012373.1 LLM class flavin-dependent oxidoreductase [Haloechinothrix sp. LS1_15]
MRVGIVILTEDRWWSGEPKWRGAEELGFDHAWTYDHLGWRSLVDGPWFAALPTLTAAATVTEQIQLGTFVATPNFRHPVSFARELITLDDICDGRLICGLGAGANGYDRTVFGLEELSPGQRAERFGEFVESLDGLLTRDGFNYQGSHYTAVAARNLPGCVQHPRVPFVIAANGPRTLRLAARFGSGWVTTGYPSDDLDAWWGGVATLTSEFERALEQEGRQPGEIRRYLSLDAAPVYSLTCVNTFTEAADKAHKLGFTDVVVHWPRSGEPYAGREAVLERVADEVLEEVRDL